MRRALAALLLVAAAACNNPSEAPFPEEPEAPKTLTVYSGRSEELVGPLFKRFEEDSGIKLAVKYGDSAELAALLLEEGKGSPADVFVAQDAGSLGAVQKEGSLTNVPSDRAEEVDAKFRSKSWVGVSGRARVLVFNPDKVSRSDLPNSVLGLTDTKWKDRIGYAPSNGSFQSFITAFRKLKGQEAAKQWLSAMKANGAKIYPKNDAIVKAVSAGEIDAGLVNHYYALQLKSKDPALKAENHFFDGGDPGALVNVAGAGILSTSKNKPGAEEFLEFLLSEDSQKYFATKTFEYPLIEGLDAPASLPPLADIKSPKIDLSDLNDLKGTLDLLKETGLL